MPRIDYGTRDLRRTMTGQERAIAEHVNLATLAKILRDDGWPVRARIAAEQARLWLAEFWRRIEDDEIDSYLADAPGRACIEKAPAHNELIETRAGNAAVVHGERPPSAKSRAALERLIDAASRHAAGERRDQSIAPEEDSLP